MKSKFADGTATLYFGLFAPNAGWAVQFYIPKVRLERYFPDLRLVGFNVQAHTALRFIWYREKALAVQVLGFGFAVQHVTP